MNYIRTIIDFLGEAIRTGYPFFVCMMGATFFAIGWNDERDGAGFVVTVIAVFSFIWAIELAYARGKAKGESETAAKITAMLTSGGDPQKLKRGQHNAKKAAAAEQAIQELAR